MKHYKANKKGFIRFLLVGFVLLPTAIFFLDKETFLEKPYILLPLITPLAIISWIYMDTSYQINQSTFSYRSGFLRGKLEIDTIREVVVGKTMWAGLRPALATKGLIIKYNKYETLYIAPENKEELISDMLKINPTIQVIKVE